MRAGEFARRRGRIEHNERVAGIRGRRRLRALVKRAGAIRILAHGRIVGYRMRDGSVACVKERYRSEVAAHVELQRIAVTAPWGYIPVRAYRCELCDGWHLTSRPA